MAEATAAAEVEDGALDVELDCETGVVTLLGMAPHETTWTPELLDLLRRGGSLWCSIEGDVIELRVKPNTLWYRLTGEIDEWDCPIAERCDAEGEPWRD